MSLPLQAFSCLVIYFLPFIAEGSGMFYRIGHLIMGEKMLRDGAAASLRAVTECHVLEPQKKRGAREGGRRKQTDTFRRTKMPLANSKISLFMLNKCTWARIHNIFLHREQAGGWRWIVWARVVGVWSVSRMLNTSWVMGGGESMLKFNGALWLGCR